MIGRSESCGKGYCQVFNFICDTDTSSTKTCGETFRIQSRTLNCNSEKVDHLLKYRICGEAPYFGKAKTKLKARFNNYKSAHRSFGKKRKVLQQCFQQWWLAVYINWTMWNTRPVAGEGNILATQA